MSVKAKSSFEGSNLLSNSADYNFGNNYSVEINNQPNNGIVFSNISSPINYVSKIESPNDESLSFFVAIILAFLGGIILNIMPCVFPVIALKVMTFIKEAGEGGAWKHGLAFSLGVELSMLVLLSAVILLT